MLFLQNSVVASAIYCGLSVRNFIQICSNWKFLFYDVYRGYFYPHSVEVVMTLWSSFVKNLWRVVAVDYINFTSKKIIVVANLNYTLCSEKNTHSHFLLYIHGKMMENVQISIKFSANVYEETIVFHQ